MSKDLEPREREDLDARRVYYVYYWKRVGDTYPFYVGKGKRDRAFSVSNRNPYFTNIYKKNECEVTIVVSGLDEMLAYEIEKALIYYFWRLGKCEANMIEGGTGGKRPEKNQKVPVSPGKKGFRWITPMGVFKSTYDAGEANGCDPTTVARRCRNKKFPSWRLEN